MYSIIWPVIMVAFLWQGGAAETVQLTESNVNDILGSSELVFVNFYADWCRFSQMLKPTFEEAYTKIQEEFKLPGQITFAKVDCDKETTIAKSYHVSKYPTLKLFRFGQLAKREFRGQRSVEAFAKYIREQLVDPIKQVADTDDLDNVDRKKRHIIGYFANTDSVEYKTYQKVASTLREDCVFHAAIGEVSEKERFAGDKVMHKPPGEKSHDMVYSGQLFDNNILMQWTTDKCVPLVREITFENAEELTEEGLPFLILFHNPDDTETPEQYRKIVARELIGEKSTINFLTADGLKFSHPLYHLGKTTKDLPILAIDSFRHMYLWKNSPKTDLEKGSLLKEFIKDLHSGKLHREFHHGPDTAKKVETVPSTGGHIPKDSLDNKVEQPTNPPESTFKKLGPSENRYTILNKDEL